MSTVILITLLCYVLVLFVLAFISGRKADNSAFFIGSRKTSWYMAAFAMVGAAMSGVTFISVPGSVATESFSYMQMVIGFTVGQLVVAFLLVPLFYRLNVVSLYEYLDNRFGAGAYKVGAWFFFISKVTLSALKLYLVCAIMQWIVFDDFGFPFWANISCTVGLVWLYTFRGGVKSLIWTDALQSLCLVGSLVLCVIYMVDGLGISLVDMTREVVASPQSKVFFFEDSSSRLYFWKMFFGGVFILIAMTGLDQDMMQRNLSCRSIRDSQVNIVITAICQIFVILLFLILGVLLYKYMDHHNLDLSLKGDQVFAHVAVNGGLPTVVSILFVLGLVSSTYSAAGASLTALTTSFTVDILEGKKRFANTALTRLRHVVHFAIALAIGLVIFIFDSFGNDSVLNLLFRVASYTYGPILGMFAFGIFTKFEIRDRWMPIVAILAPILSWGLQYGAKYYYGYEIGYELLVYNALFTIFGMLLLRVKRDKYRGLNYR